MESTLTYAHLTEEIMGRHFFEIFPSQWNLHVSQSSPDQPSLHLHTGPRMHRPLFTHSSQTSKI